MKEYFVFSKIGLFDENDIEEFIENGDADLFSFEDGSLKREILFAFVAGGYRDYWVLTEAMYNRLNKL